MLAVIEKGNHLSNQPFLTFPLHIGKVWERKVRFHNNCRPVAINPENQDDIHKVGGFSLGLDADKNSLRFGWSYDYNYLNEILLHSYAHVEYIKKHKSIIKIHHNVDYILDIRIVSTKGNYITVLYSVYKYDSQALIVSTIEEYNIKYIPYGILRYFYHGGDEVAIKRMIAEISKV